MNHAARKTRACTIDALDEDLKAAIRSHEREFGLEDLESDILMCCETITLCQRKGHRGGLQTTLSAVYVTPKWLVWAESTGQNDVAAGTAQLQQIDVQDYRTTAQYGIAPDPGLKVVGRYTGQKKTRITFIVLEAEEDGQRFRHVLDKALRSAAG